MLGDAPGTLVVSKHCVWSMVLFRFQNVFFCFRNGFWNLYRFFQRIWVGPLWLCKFGARGGFNQTDTHANARVSRNSESGVSNPLGFHTRIPSFADVVALSPKSGNDENDFDFLFKNDNVTWENRPSTVLFSQTMILLIRKPSVFTQIFRDNNFILKSFKIIICGSIFFVIFPLKTKLVHQFSSFLTSRRVLTKTGL